jgi:hypothetical protein
MYFVSISDLSWIYTTDNSHLRVAAANPLGFLDGLVNFRG